MAKTIKLTEADLLKLVKRVIKEQDEEEYKITTAIQKFLNNRYKNDKTFKQLRVDGRTGPNSETAKAIKKYQEEKKLDVNGNIEHETTSAMRKDGLGKFEDKLFGIFE